MSWFHDLIFGGDEDIRSKEKTKKPNFLNIDKNSKSIRDKLDDKRDDKLKDVGRKEEKKKKDNKGIFIFNLQLLLNIEINLILE